MGRGGVVAMTTPSDLKMAYSSVLYHARTKKAYRTVSVSSSPKTYCIDFITGHSKYTVVICGNNYQVCYFILSKGRGKVNNIFPRFVVKREKYVLNVPNGLILLYYGCHWF